MTVRKRIAFNDVIGSIKHIATWRTAYMVLVSVVALCWIRGVLFGIDWEFWYTLLTRSTPAPGADLSGFRKFALVHSFNVSALIALWWHPIMKRVLASWNYCYFCLTLMSFSSSIAWFRNPNHMGHVPDLVHELIGGTVEHFSLPWPLSAISDTQFNCVHVLEVLMNGLIVITVLWALTQPWRWLALRRWLVIQGTLALMRTMTVLVTNLPDSRPFCHEATKGTTLYHLIDWEAVWGRTFKLATQEDPVTCGDMVYSGHTMVLVVCGMAWHGYYKVLRGTFTVNVVKMVIWSVISCCLMLILATRLHYTLDVLLAFYLTITLWGAYHRAADDVLVGHRYIAVYIFDGLVLYPAITWLEAPHLGEAMSFGMVSKYPRAVTRTAALKQVQWVAQVCAHYFKSMYGNSGFPVNATPASAIKPYPAIPSILRAGASGGAGAAPQSPVAPPAFALPGPAASPGPADGVAGSSSNSNNSEYSATGRSRGLTAYVTSQVAQSSPPIITLPRSTFDADSGDSEVASGDATVSSYAAEVMNNHLMRTRTNSEMQAEAELVAQVITTLKHMAPPQPAPAAGASGLGTAAGLPLSSPNGVRGMSLPADFQSSPLFPSGSTSTAALGGGSVDIAAVVGIVQKFNAGLIAESAADAAAVIARESLIESTRDAHAPPSTTRPHSESAAGSAPNTMQSDATDTVVIGNSGVGFSESRSGLAVRDFGPALRSALSWLKRTVPGSASLSRGRTRTHSALDAGSIVAGSGSAARTRGSSVQGSPLASAAEAGLNGRFFSSDDAADGAADSEDANSSMLPSELRKRMAGGGARRPSQQGL